MSNCTIPYEVRNYDKSLSIDDVSGILMEPDRTKLSTIPPEYTYILTVWE